MVERKKKAKKVSTKGGVKQTVKQTVKVVVGDIGKKKAVRRRPTKKPAPGLTRPATGAYSGVGISDRVVIPPLSRADPSLYNKDALLALTAKIDALTYKADNPPLNVSGYLGNRTQQRLTDKSNLSNEAYPSGVKIETGGPDLVEADPITDKRVQRAIRKASRREPSFTGFSNMFQQEQINKGNASAKAQQKKEELKDEKFAPIVFLEEPMTETSTEIDEEVIQAKPKPKTTEQVKPKSEKLYSTQDALKKIARLNK